MPRCPDCGQLVSVHEDHCPTCRPANDERFPVPALAESVAADDDNSEERTVAIARFHNGAEAGYFADELAHELNLETQVLAREQFDALHASWSTDYVLLVPESDAERAAQALQQLVKNTDDDEADHDGLLDSENTTRTASGPIWVPLILTLAAGSLAYWGVEKVEQRPRPPALVNRDRRPPPDLMRTLGKLPGPWVQKEGPLTRELQIHPESNTATLREDRDGDGRFEREWEYSWRE